MTMPPADFFSSSMRLTITRSCNGRIFMPHLPIKSDGLQWLGIAPKPDSGALSTQPQRVLIIAMMEALFKQRMTRFAFLWLVLALTPVLARSADLPREVLQALRA